MSDLLVEIGTEELPAALCPGAIAQLDGKGRALLASLRLSFTASRALGTPRRLAWLVSGLDARQPDQVDWVRGPARTVAFDPDGRPTRAAVGFAAAQGVAVADLELRETHVFARRVDPGRGAAEVLREAIPALVASVEFPRTMRWGDLDFRFARPIRWLVALLDAEVIPCTVAGVASGRTTFGQRTLHPGPLELHRPLDYEGALEAAHVLADPAVRRARIWAQVDAAAAALGGRARADEGLLDEVNFLVEWPAAFAGRFAAAALELPEEVLVTVMRVHQRYFPVEGVDGRLKAAFVGVRNGGSADLDAIVAGNEKVLRARLADARFFYEEDRRQPLVARVEGLAAVAAAPGMGDMRQKAERLVWLFSNPLDPMATRAALLCKADRLTHLVYELPEIEGVMGEHYARLDGEPPEVARAIGEHVLPRAAGDALPVTPLGRRLALADRFDNLVGHFALGRAPTGSADPFGLRRQALAVLRILAAADTDGDADGSERLGVLVDRAYAAYRSVGPALPRHPAGDVLAFLRARLEGLLLESGYRYDVARAVLAAGCERVPDVWRRADAVTRLLAAPAFDDVMTAFRRSFNLSQKLEQPAETVHVRPELFAHPAEGALFDALGEAKVTAKLILTARPDPDYEHFYVAAAKLRAPVDAFLDAVLVMDPDPAVRTNRLTLLKQVADLVAGVADLSQLTVS